MRLTVESVSNGFILSARNTETCQEEDIVFHADEKQELLQQICKTLEIGSDVIDWSDGEKEQTGGTPSANRLSVEDI